MQGKETLASLLEIQEHPEQDLLMAIIVDFITVPTPFSHSACLSPVTLYSPVAERQEADQGDHRWLTGSDKSL